MILVNSTWGKLLDEHGIAAIYRAQSGGKVRMTTSASEHQGLGTSHYAWTSSPLRRYVDLVNQWQLIALIRGESAPFSRNEESMLGIAHDFESTYAVYDEFQRHMERYWCLRKLIQDERDVVTAEVVRDNLVKFEALPLYSRVPSLPQLPVGTSIELEIIEVNLYDSELRCVFKGQKGS